MMILMIIIIIIKRYIKQYY